MGCLVPTILAMCSLVLPGPWPRAVPGLAAIHANDYDKLYCTCWAAWHGLLPWAKAGLPTTERWVYQPWCHAQAIASPEDYVLKPQREGGGNNLYGEELRARLQQGGPGLAAFVLMQRIKPPVNR